MKIYKRLRYQLPLLTLLFIIFSLLSGYIISLNISRARQIRIGERNMSERLNVLQGISEILINENHPENINNIFSSYASEKDMINLIAADPEGIVFASTSFSDIGETINQLPYQLDKNAVSEAIQNNSTVILMEEKGRYLQGYSSLCKSSHRGQVIKKECGFIYYKTDLNYHYQMIKKDFLLQLFLTGAGMLAGSILLLFAVNFLIAKRTETIIEGISKFIQGDRKQKIFLKGDDELSDLSKSVNSLFADISTGEYLLKENEERLSSIINTILDGIIVINKKGIIISFNPAAENLFGYRSEEVTGKNVKILMPEPYSSSHDDYLNHYLETGEKKVIGIGREVTGLRKDGSTFPMDLAISEMHLWDDVYFTGIVRDITERKLLSEKLEKSNQDLLRSNQKLKEIAITDGLTGLYNRRYFDIRLSEEIKRLARSENSLSLILCDIDFFKLYNDSYGHLKGDECLKSVAEVIKSKFKRGGEICARYGGEEFAVILPGVDSSLLENLSRELRNAVLDRNTPHGNSKASPYVTLSIGGASITRVMTDKANFSNENLIAMADEMLYRAKEMGRNTFIIHPG
ncbi:MAG: diguanylate cyclase [Spirochaetia bacterium]|nr:diguanylate cyclase [Spirochaetia bacterium]